jgi:hypothetical protein
VTGEHLAFAGLSEYAHCSMHVYLQEYVRAFQVALCAFIFQAFPFKFCGKPIVCPTSVHYFRQLYLLNALTFFIFDKYLWGKEICFYAANFESGEIKISVADSFCL